MQPTTDIPPEYVSIPALKSIYALSRSEVYRRLASGELYAVKVGGRTHVNLESVRRFMASRPRATYRPPMAKVTA